MKDLPEGFITAAFAVFEKYDQSMKPHMEVDHVSDSVDGDDRPMVDATPNPMDIFELDPPAFPQQEPSLHLHKRSDDSGSDSPPPSQKKHKRPKLVGSQGSRGAVSPPSTPEPAPPTTEVVPGAVYPSVGHCVQVVFDTIRMYGRL